MAEVKPYLEKNRLKVNVTSLPSYIAKCRQGCHVGHMWSLKM